MYMRMLVTSGDAGEMVTVDRDGSEIQVIRGYAWTTRGESEASEVAACRWLT